MPRFLFVGDIHLGRRPTKLPDDLRGARAAELGPAAAWGRAVELAIEEKVDAVVLAGDVVESVEDRFAAYGHLQAGVARLTETGISVIGVAGNHDVEALPRLAKQVPAFRLLGPGGTWSHEDVTGADGVTVRLLGWSFPRARHLRDPLEGLEVPRAAGVAVLGVLHCELDGPRSSPYAPVRRADLAAQPVDAWLLGHVHRPDDLAGNRPIGYLGSLSGLDPGEPGAHGPWIVEVEGPGKVRATKVPLAPMRYEEVVVPVGELAVDDEIAPEQVLEGAILGALAEVAARCDADGSEAKGIACRIVLRGRTAHHAAFAKALAAGLPSLDATHGARLVFVEKIVDDAEAALDLEALARGTSPPALLARHLLDLAAGGDAAGALVSEARARLGAVAAQPAFAALDDAAPDDEEVRRYLERAGREALERLLEEKAPG